MRLHFTVIASFVVLLLGCQREREFKGQVFLVTEKQENLKLGLVPIHVVRDDILQQLANELRNEYAVAVAAAEPNWALLKSFSQELAVLQFGDHPVQQADQSTTESGDLILQHNRLRSDYSVPEIRRIAAEIEDRSSKLWIPLLQKDGPANRLFASLPLADAKTDADGKFSVRAPGKSWILAETTTTSDNRDEQHFWVVNTDSLGDQMLLANDNQLKGSASLFNALRMGTNGVSTGRSIEKMQPDPELVKWVEEARTRAKFASAEAEKEALSRAQARSAAEEAEKKKRQKAALLYAEADPAATVKTRPRRLAAVIPLPDSRSANLGEKVRQTGGVRRFSIESNLDVRSIEFGAYHAAILANIQKRWFDLLEDRDISRGGIGKVVLEFHITSDGRITNMREQESEVASVLGLICQRAVQDPAPYGAWPPELRRIVGKDFREVRFVFHYN